jgi:integrase
VLAQLHEEISGSKLEDLSCRDHFKEWLATKKPETGPRTFDFYSASLGKFLVHLGTRADVSISEITKADVIAHRNQLAKNLRAKTVNHRLRVLKMVFKAAKRDGLIAEDPCEFVDPVKVTDSRKRRGFTIEEIASVLSVADPQWQSLIKFGLYSGQRLGDLSRLTWSNVDLERNELRMVTAKTGKTIILPLAGPLRHHVETLPIADSLEEPIHPRAFAQKRIASLSNQFGDLLAQAGLREKVSHKKQGEGRSAKRAANELSFHSLRHSTVSFLHEAGLPQATILEYVGHSSVAMNQRYTHVGSAELTRAANALPNVGWRLVKRC